MLEVTGSELSVGDIVHVYSTRWEGPQAAMVVRKPDGQGVMSGKLLLDRNNQDCANAVNYAFNHSDCVEAPVYDPLSDEDRQSIIPPAVSGKKQQAIWFEIRPSDVEKDNRHSEVMAEVMAIRAKSSA